ncbi:hypothetical protein ACFC0D_07645 [Streptomyces sp. NPDC056222]|uniref:hypothetical protein n=1 Tax=Streptomyces sp. NPDC056222 TaxID=3345749 RepID=UPI0035D782F5
MRSNDILEGLALNRALPVPLLADGDGRIAKAAAGNPAPPATTMARLIDAP